MSAVPSAVPPSTVLDHTGRVTTKARARDGVAHVRAQVSVRFHPHVAVDDVPLAIGQILHLVARDLRQWCAGRTLLEAAADLDQVHQAIAPVKAPAVAAVAVHIISFVGMREREREAPPLAEAEDTADAPVRVLPDASAASVDAASAGAAASVDAASVDADADASSEPDTSPTLVPPPTRGGCGGIVFGVVGLGIVAYLIWASLCAAVPTP